MLQVWISEALHGLDVTLDDRALVPGGDENTDTRRAGEALRFVARGTAQGARAGGVAGPSGQVEGNPCQYPADQYTGRRAITALPQALQLSGETTHANHYQRGLSVARADVRKQVGVYLLELLAQERPAEPGFDTLATAFAERGTECGILHQSPNATRQILGIARYREQTTAGLVHNLAYTR